MIVNINLQDKTVRNVYDIFKKYNIDFSVENIKLFFKIILDMNIEDINFGLDYGMELELKPSTFVAEDINSNLFYEIIQDIKLDCNIEDINISTNLDIEVGLSLNYILEDINFNCVATLVVVRTYSDIKGLFYGDIKNETYGDICWAEK